MNPTSPFFSIITATYNASEYLPTLLKSLRTQTYQNFQLIIADGGSNDGTQELIEQYRDIVAVWFSAPDQGIYDAWNKALPHAQGEWICFLGADDRLWDKFVLAHMAEKLTTLPPDLNLAYGKVMLLNADGVPLYQVGQPWPEIKERFRQIMNIPHPGLMHRRKLFEVHGNFDSSFRIAGDYEFLLRELKNGEAVFLPDITVAGMTQGGASSLPQNTLLSLLEVRRAQRLHGLPLSTHWLLALSRVYLRAVLWALLGEQRTRHLLDLGRHLRGLPPHWTRT